MVCGLTDTYKMLNTRLASSTVELAPGPSSCSSKKSATAGDTSFFLPALCLSAREDVALDLCSQVSHSVVCDPHHAGYLSVRELWMPPCNAEDLNSDNKVQSHQAPLKNTHNTLALAGPDMAI